MPPSGRSTTSTTRPSNREREKSLPMVGRRTARKPSACSRSLRGISVASSPAALGEGPLSDSVHIRSPRARHGSFLPVRFEALGSRASLASPVRSTRPAVPHGVREKRARGGRSAARSPDERAPHPAGEDRGTLSGWIERGRPARAGGESLSGPLFEAERSGAENIPLSGRERAGGFPGRGAVDQHRVGKN